MNRTRHEAPEDDTMNNRYLWDGSGEPSPEVQQLENALGRFRHSGAGLVFGSGVVVPRSRFRNLVGQMPWLPRIAAAVVLVLSLATSILLTRTPTRTPEPRSSWEVASLEGEVQVGTTHVTTGQMKARLEVGQILETSENSRASISEKWFGQIEVEPGSRVRLEQSGDKRARIQLDRGTIHAAIWAPPGQFVVDTPSAVAVDLGCAYTLQVARDGSGSIRTTLGWVGFHLNGRQAFIPAGAMCSTRPLVGPGTPYFEDASATFRAALSEYDSAGGSGDSRAAALAIVLAGARTKDGLTLWHLLSRTDGADRAQVYERFAELVSPPSGVTRDGVLRLNQQMLDLWWNSLDLGDISIWRYWEQSGTSRVGIGAQIIQEKQPTRLRR